jgi:hypothetical protein
MGGKDLLSCFKEGMQPTPLESIRDGFPGDEDPVVGCDVATWINGSLRSLKPAIAQFHSQPNVPIIAVGDHVQEKIQQLLDHKFRPVLVFDGQSNPSKGVAHGIRCHALDGKIEELESVCRGEVPGATHNDVLKLQKETVVARNDVLFHVLAVAKEMKVDVIGSPFEADHMLVSLANQDLLLLSLNEAANAESRTKCFCQRPCLCSFSAFIVFFTELSSNVGSWITLPLASSIFLKALVKAWQDMLPQQHLVKDPQCVFLDGMTSPHLPSRNNEELADMLDSENNGKNHRGHKILKTMRSHVVVSIATSTAVVTAVAAF